MLVVRNEKFPGTLIVFFFFLLFSEGQFYFSVEAVFGPWCV
jgi:hypothetical protein